MVFRMIQVSDAHLSARRAYGVANFEAVVAAANAAAPDLVVASGDLALDDVDDDADRLFARSCLDRLSAPWRALPGNHDVGDTLPEPWMDQVVTADRRLAWVEAWGPDWWVEEADDWLVVGLDSLLFASDLPAEADQWSWLEGVARHAGRRPVMLVLHKPLCLWDPDESTVNQTAVVPEGRRRLREALGGARLRLVASGHVHQYRTWSAEGVAMVWAPSTAFVSRPGEPSRYGARKVVGTIEYRFRGRGVAWDLLRPPGMVDHDVGTISGGAPSLRSAPLCPLTT